MWTPEGIVRWYLHFFLCVFRMDLSENIPENWQWILDEEPGQRSLMAGAICSSVAMPSFLVFVEELPCLHIAVITDSCSLHICWIDLSPCVLWVLIVGWWSKLLLWYSFSASSPSVSPVLLPRREAEDVLSSSSFSWVLQRRPGSWVVSHRLVDCTCAAFSRSSHSVVWPNCSQKFLPRRLPKTNKQTKGKKRRKKKRRNPPPPNFLVV